LQNHSGVNKKWVKQLKNNLSIHFLESGQITLFDSRSVDETQVWGGGVLKVFRYVLLRRGRRGYLGLWKNQGRSVKLCFLHFYYQRFWQLFLGVTLGDPSNSPRPHFPCVHLCPNYKKNIPNTFTTPGYSKYCALWVGLWYFFHLKIE
jgi:hypothetical protein